MREDLGNDCRGGALHEVAEACTRLFECISMSTSRRFFELIIERLDVTGTQHIKAAADGMFGEDFLALFGREAKPIWECMDNIFNPLRGTAHWKYIHERLALAGMHLMLRIDVPQFASVMGFPLQTSIKWTVRHKIAIVNLNDEYVDE
ncbi:hypothetical protein B0J17DRAFT_634058 [Rhizoctonia solani]|nr:hypothetical protein B0J17DRAFT_634058 [Rhizoctonia solani]